MVHQGHKRRSVAFMAAGEHGRCVNELLSLDFKFIFALIAQSRLA
jgi:hypothetical protein